jgi:ATP-binding cassette, subfamily B, bacterial PglK
LKEKKTNLVESTVRVVKTLPSRRRKQIPLILMLMLIVAVIEAISVGMIALFATSISNPNEIINSVYITHLKKIMPNGFLQSTNDIVMFLSILVVGTLLLKSTIKTISDYISRLYVGYIGCIIGKRLLSGFLRIPYEWHSSKNSADLVLAVYWRVHIARFLKLVLQAIASLIFVTVMIMVVVTVNPLVSLVIVILGGGCSVVLFIVFRKYLDRLGLKARILDQSINRDVTKAIHGLKDVRIGGHEESHEQFFDLNVNQETRIKAIQEGIGPLSMSILEIVGFTILVSAIWVMLFVTNASSVETIGTIALITVAVWRILPNMNNILNSLTTIRSALPWVDLELGYLDELKSWGEEIRLSDNRIAKRRFESELTLRKVDFTYQGAKSKALSGIDLTITKGKTIGIIGVSGSGKSTLADILVGLLSPTHGEIEFDGEKLSPSQYRKMRRNFGYITQSPYIFDGTLAENIAFGVVEDQIDKKKVLKCCGLAAMGNFLDKLPLNIDTPLGERGVKLSGGQQQRVSIARALYHEPDLLIFDEATSSLDTKNEKAIQETIFNFKGKQTLIIIAHRLSTVENCDVLIWLENGEIRKSGKPVEILSAYKEMLQTQESST